MGLLTLLPLSCGFLQTLSSWILAIDTQLIFEFILHGGNDMADVFMANAGTQEGC